MTTRNNYALGGLFLAANVAFSAAASTVPFYDDFDAGYTDGQSLAAGSKGWETTSNSVVVRAGAGMAGTLAALVPHSEVASNRFATVSATNVWTDFYVSEVQHVPDGWPIDVDTNQAVMLYMNTSSQVVVYDPVAAQWRICMTDYCGNAVSTFFSGGWAHISVNQNYSADKAAVFLQGHLLVEQLRLINTNLTSFQTVALSAGGSCTSFFDNVTVTNGWPSAAYVTNDVDADGKADAEEIHLYGTASRWTGVRQVPGQYATIQQAMDVAFSGETVIVASNQANETVTLASGVTLIVTNGTVTINGQIRSGTFTVVDGWGWVVPRAVPFVEDFEAYGTGTMVATLGDRGWLVSTTGTTVKAGVGVGGSRAVELAAQDSLTNLWSAGGASNTNLWVDLYVNETMHVPDRWPMAVDLSQSVSLYVNTSRYVVVYNSALPGWDVCSNDVFNAGTTDAYSNGWNRITLNVNYGSHQAALFLNGRLLRDRLGFISGTSRNIASNLCLSAGAGSLVMMDSLTVTNRVLVDLTADGDRDCIADAREIDLYGNLDAVPTGSVFKIR
jgi:hypothetical protein